MLKPTPLLLAVIAGSALVLALLYAYTSSRSAAPLETPASRPLDSPVAAHPDDSASVDETRRLAMQEAYADLEKDRRLLNRQLGSLNANVWGLRLPAARAQSIQQDMMGAQKLLTNPPLQGAFLDVEGIQHEQDRVNAALERLKAIEGELSAGM